MRQATAALVVALSACASVSEKFDELAEQACACGTDDVCALRVRAGLSRLRKEEPAAAEAVAGTIRYAEICIADATRPAAVAAHPPPAPATAPIAASAVSPPAASVPDPIVISARKLARAYEANELAADELYKGALLRVTGKVHSVGKDAILGHVTVVMDGGNFEIVSCDLGRSPRAEVLRLRKGRGVRLLGTGVGGGWTGPRLTSCKLEAYEE